MGQRYLLSRAYSLRARHRSFLPRHPTRLRVQGLGRRCPARSGSSGPYTHGPRRPARQPDDVERRDLAGIRIFIGGEVSDPHAKSRAVRLDLDFMDVPLARRVVPDLDSRGLGADAGARNRSTNEVRVLSSTRFIPIRPCRRVARAWRPPPSISRAWARASRGSPGRRAWRHVQCRARGRVPDHGRRPGG